MHSDTITCIGVDGCRAGWFCVGLGAGNSWSYRLAADTAALGTVVSAVDRVLIDIPIGLADSGPDGRRCDREARRLLGRGRAASVFSPPARPTLAASSYPAGLALNRQATGSGLSLQAWGITAKIRDIDELLRSRRPLRRVVREAHPELCFWALNRRQAMSNNKKTAAGRQERLAVLERFFPRCRVLFDQAAGEFLRREVALDDIIDAMVCAVTAKYANGNYRTLPDRPPVDGQGLPMEIVYFMPH